MLTTRLRSLARLSPGDRALLAGAALRVAAIRMALWVLPFRVLRRLLDAPIARSARPGPGVDRLVWAVRSAAGFVPRATCLTQALALHRLLIRAGHPSELHIGIAKDGNLEAHAWVEHAGRVWLTTQAEAARYTTLVSWRA